MIYFSGTANLQKVIEKNQLDWDLNTPQNIDITATITYTEHAGSEDFYRTVVRRCSLSGVWAVAMYQELDSKMNPVIRAYMKNAIGSTGSYHITVETSTRVGSTGEIVTNIQELNGTSNDVFGLFTMYAPSDRDVDSVSSSVSGDIVLLPDYAKVEDFLIHGGDPNEYNTNGINNNNVVIAGSVDRYTLTYNGVEISSAQTTVPVTGMPYEIYRQGVYCVPVSSKDKKIWLPVELGTSYIGGRTDNKYVNGLSGGSYRMYYNQINTQYFPNVEYDFSGIITQNYYNDEHIGYSDSNESYTAIVSGNGTYAQSLMPAAQLPEQEWDSIDSTFNSSVPKFDSHDKLVQYLLGEINEDEAVNDEIFDNSEDTNNDEPEQTMVNGVGVNFT